MKLSNPGITHNGNIKRLGLLIALAMLSATILSACGTSSDTSGTGSISAATATAPAATDSQAQAVPTDTPAAMGSTDATPTTDAAATAATPTPATASAQTTGQSTQVQATLKEWAIDLSQSEVSAGKVTFVVTNAGQMSHNLTVTGDSGVLGQTPVFNASQGTQTLEVDLKPGTYTIICSLPGHAARGQKTTLVVK